MAKRWSRAISMGCWLWRCSTHAPSHSTSTGTAREQHAPKTFASRIVSAEPRRFSRAIFPMNFGTSICVGHAAMQGASKQLRQRFASTRAACGANGGCRSWNFSAMDGSCRMGPSGFDEIAVHIGTAVAEELPGFSDFGDLFEIEIGGKHLVLVARRLRKDLPARIAEVALPIKLADVPRR